MTKAWHNRRGFLICLLILVLFRTATSQEKDFHAVNGRKDTLFSDVAIERAVRETKTIYKAAGHAERFEHRWGAAGHRFYADLMWPFVLDAFS